MSNDARHLHRISIIQDLKQILSTLGCTTNHEGPCFRSACLYKVKGIYRLGTSILLMAPFVSCFLGVLECRFVTLVCRGS